MVFAIYASDQIGNAFDKPKPRKGPAPGYKAPIKYRGPNGEIWTGRGKMPLWMVAAGGDKEQFRVKEES